MTVLNQNIEWTQLVQADDRVAKAFLGVPGKILLRSGTMLCRFITTQRDKKLTNSPNKKREGTGLFESAWWLDWGLALAEIGQWRTPHNALKDVVRGRLSITARYSRVQDGLVQIVLDMPVYGWQGIAKRKTDRRRRVAYLGGCHQLYIPHLASHADGLKSEVAHMHCFTAIESIDD